MRISAQNRLDGVVKEIKNGEVNCEVRIALDDGGEIVSLITLNAAKELGLTKGKKVKALIKANDVLVGL